MHFAIYYGRRSPRAPDPTDSMNDMFHQLCLIMRETLRLDPRSNHLPFPCFVFVFVST